MNIFKFELPPREERVINRSWFTVGLEKFGKHGADPDYYICYRVGYDMRILALILGLFAALLGMCVQSFSLGSFGTGKSLYDLYVLFSSFFGPVFLCFLYGYFRGFKEYVDFNDYNFLRFADLRIDSKERLVLMKRQNLLFVWIGLFVIAFPYFITGILYTQWYGDNAPKFFDEALLVVVLSILLSGVQSVLMQYLFIHTNTYKYLKHLEKETQYQ